jgi:hypothetical protein
MDKLRAEWEEQHEKDAAKAKKKQNKAGVLLNGPSEEETLAYRWARKKRGVFGFGVWGLGTEERCCEGLGFRKKRGVGGVTALQGLGRRERLGG